jgi:hypothetical protein
MPKDKHDTYGIAAAKELSYANLYRIFSDLGVSKIYTKALAANDNSKNQIYLGGDFSAINIIPIQSWESFTSSSNKKSLKPGLKLVRGTVNFKWVDATGRLCEAPGAKVILYPQFPEVRFSGFLSGSSANLGQWMDVKKSGRKSGRFLILGIHPSGQTYGYLAVPGSQIASELAANGFSVGEKILQELSHPDSLGQSSRIILLNELRRIYMASPIESKKLNGKTLKPEPYKARNGAGFTLEAELGVAPNGYAAPDFEGWEIKAHGSQVVTLMTPEPSGGIYQDKGIDVFMRQYGYPAMNGEPDRINFGGVHKSGVKAKRTGLTLRTIGYSSGSDKVDLSGSISLLGEHNEVAAEWSYEKLLAHWNKKHAQAAYVDYDRQTIGGNYWYSYHNRVYLGIGTDFLKFLKAVSSRAVYYDPGIKMEAASSPKPKVKKRSQFRVSFKNISSLYDSWEVVNLDDS